MSWCVTKRHQRKDGHICPKEWCTLFVQLLKQNSSTYYRVVHKPFLDHFLTELSEISHWFIGVHSDCQNSQDCGENGLKGADFEKDVEPFFMHHPVTCNFLPT